MGLWLFKQEPASYSYDQLQKDGGTVWDGVTNNLALKHLRNVRQGDKAFFYHTGEEKSVVGIMEIASSPYPDPKDKSLVVVDVKPLAKLSKPVSLKSIKDDKSFSDWELVKISRLSVMPVPDRIWKTIMEMPGS